MLANEEGSETVPTAQPSPEATSVTPLSCAAWPDGYTAPSGTRVAVHPLPFQCSAYGLVNSAVGGCPGLNPPTASTSDADAAATPSSCPRAPAGALLVVPHATGCAAAAAQVVPSTAPHTAASTATARPVRLAFMPSPLRRQVPWILLFPDVGRLCPMWAANEPPDAAIPRAGSVRTPFIRRARAGVLAGEAGAGHESARRGRACYGSLRADL